MGDPKGISPSLSTSIARSTRSSHLPCRRRSSAWPNECAAVWRQQVLSTPERPTPRTGSILPPDAGASTSLPSPRTRSLRGSTSRPAPAVRLSVCRLAPLRLDVVFASLLSGEPLVQSLTRQLQRAVQFHQAAAPAPDPAPFSNQTDFGKQGWFDG